MKRQVFALLRVSTDEQDTAKQARAIKQFAQEHGIVIARWLEDKESRDFSEIRTDFQWLLDQVRKGKVEAVVIEKFDRFGVKGPGEWFFYRYIFMENECKILSTLEGDLTNDVEDADELTMIKTLFQAKASPIEQKNISTRGLGGRLTLALRGEWVAGPAPFGFDKVCLDSQGRQVWRLITLSAEKHIQVFPGGSTLEIEGRGNCPTKGKGQRLTLAVNEEQARVVRLIFHKWTTERISLLGLASWLNRNGYRLHGRPFYGTTVKKILKQRKYLGDAVWNENLQGRFTEVRNGAIKPIPSEIRKNHRTKDGRKSKWICRTNGEDQLIIKHNAHDAIVPKEQFNRAQEKLAEVKDNKNRAPRREEFWLKDLVYCATCGKPMRSEIHKGRAWLMCNTYWQADHQGLGHSCKCGRNTIAYDDVEKMFLEWAARKRLQIHQVGANDVMGAFQTVEDEHSKIEEVLASGFHRYLDQMAEDFGLNEAELPPEKQRMKALVLSLQGQPADEKDREAVAELDNLRADLIAYQTKALEERLAEVYRNKAQGDSEREKVFWVAEQRRIEAQLDRLKEWAVPYRDRLQEAMARLQELLARLDEIFLPWADARPLQKAELARSIVKQIRLKFGKEKRGSRYCYPVLEREIVSSRTEPVCSGN